MRLKITGSGHPSTGGWKIVDENGVEVQVKSIEMRADSEDVDLKISIFDYADYELDVDAEACCSHAAQYAITRHGKRIGFCAAHIGTIRYLRSKGLFLFDFDIEALPSGGCGQFFKCGAPVL